MSTSSRVDWEQQPTDPDLERDLGYSIEPWDILTVDHSVSDHRVLLPTDEQMLKQDAYMIVPGWMVYTLEDYR